MSSFSVKSNIGLSVSIFETNCAKASNKLPSLFTNRRVVLQKLNYEILIIFQKLIDHAIVTDVRSLFEHPDRSCREIFYYQSIFKFITLHNVNLSALWSKICISMS